MKKNRPQFRPSEIDVSSHVRWDGWFEVSGIQTNSNGELIEYRRMGSFNNQADAQARAAALRTKYGIN
jgi:hypothetical protein